MNYLGHMYFSGNDTKLMQANLFGDFVKGSKLDHFPAVIQEGIRLHRKIDNYIDNFPAVKELQIVLRKELPKVSGIAVDIFFDHLLAKNWKEFHNENLNHYLDKIYASFEFSTDYYSESYIDFLKSLVNYNWMSHYPTHYGLDKMSKGVSSRLSFPNELVNGKAVFLKHEKIITTAFYDYMKAAIEYFNIKNQTFLP